MKVTKLSFEGCSHVREQSFGMFNDERKMTLSSECYRLMFHSYIST